MLNNVFNLFKYLVPRATYTNIFVLLYVENILVGMFQVCNCSDKVKFHLGFDLIIHDDDAHLLPERPNELIRLNNMTTTIVS